MPPKKSPSLEELRKRFQPKTDIPEADRANLKKYHALTGHVVAMAGAVRDMFPDDRANQDPLYAALDYVTAQARNVCERRAGVKAVAPLPPVNVLPGRSQMLAMPKVVPGEARNESPLPGGQQPATAEAPQHPKPAA